MTKLTTAQFDTLFRARWFGRPVRCVGGNPCHTALLKKGLIRIRFISRREYTIEVTPAGSAAVDAHLARRTKSTLHE